MTTPHTLSLPLPAQRSRELLTQAIELLQQVARDDKHAKDHIIVWLLARRDDGTLLQLRQHRS